MDSYLIIVLPLIFLSWAFYRDLTKTKIKPKTKKNINYYTNNFFDNWKVSKKRPFKEALIIHLKNYDQDRNVKAIIFERMQFPKNVEKEFRFDQPNKYWSDINTALEDPNFLGKVTVYEAYIFFLKVAKDNIKYFKKYDKKDFKLNQENKNELFALYQMTLVYLAGELHSNKEFRENAKIKDNEISKKVNLFKYIKLKSRLGKRFGAFTRFSNQGFSPDEARMKVDALYPANNDDYLCERDLIKLDKSWLGLILLIFIAWYLNN